KSTLCAKDNEYNNLALVGPIVNLHRKMAQLLGFRSYADMVLEKRMATDRAHVDDLLNRLFEAYYPFCVKEKEELEAFAREQMGDDYVMQPWDQSYWTHKLQKARYDLDSEMLRPYFELSQVKKGVFGLASRLYGISFVPRTDIEVYNKEVEVFEVQDADGSFLGLLYTDFHPRENKRSGAWMSTFRDQYIDKDGKDQRPLVSVVMNFTRPTDDKPALLSLGEVNTFLHEFGHALHALFSQVKFEAQSCTNVQWDFVELPSQFMENYATEPEFLRTFAFHYQTGEPMPQELIDRILRSNNFMVATGCIFQVALARLDMAYYSRTEDFEGDAREFENETWKDIKTMNRLPGECMTTHFSHIMCGGYSAGYYSYKWAEVLDADAFSLFQERGIFDRATAESFRREVLSRGDTEHPMTLYRRFRGQEPTIDALLRRNGIAPTSSSKRKEK
ncbi:MAG: M3 family metallopeptidase, partial [Bacteroidaceae bacterium]|nr:M3 family metallopeptidase [Bacteroidaceae bacterium]